MEKEILELFKFQARVCEPYARYVNLLGVDVKAITSVEKIPFMPIEFFRRFKLYCAATEPEAVFHSSGTTGDDVSSHYVSSLALYEKSFMECFTHFYGSPSSYKLITMLPSYRQGSSLLYMVSKLEPMCTGDKILVLGVSFALLEAVRSGSVQKLPPGSIVMETGGMKGRDFQISRLDLHAELCAGFGVEAVHSEYGMCELMSQAYSAGGGIFYPPLSMRIFIRDLLNPLKMLPCGSQGGINIVDINNVDSCAFIATGDRGVMHNDGGFEVLGRIEGEILRGCNALLL